MLIMSAFQIPLFPLEEESASPSQRGYEDFSPSTNSRSAEERDVLTTLETLLITPVSVKKIGEQKREKSGSLVAYHVIPSENPLPPFVLLDARHAQHIFELSSEKEHARIRRVNLSRKKRNGESLEQRILRETAHGHVSLQKQVEDTRAFYRTEEGRVFNEYARAYAGVLVYLVTGDMVRRKEPSPRLVVIGGVQDIVLSAEFNHQYESVRVKPTSFIPLYQETISSKVTVNQDGYPSKKHEPVTRSFLSKLEEYVSQKNQEIQRKRHTHLGKYRLVLKV